MNTKMLFLLLIALFITNGKFSSATVSHNGTTQVNATGSHAPGKQNKPGDEVPPVDVTSAPFKKMYDPNSDDDGKHHHFHFERITCIGCRRFLLLLLSKFVLILSQVCCFIYCVTHVFH